MSASSRRPAATESTIRPDGSHYTDHPDRTIRTARERNTMPYTPAHRTHGSSAAQAAAHAAAPAAAPPESLPSLRLGAQYHRILRRWPTLVLVWALVLLAAVLVGLAAKPSYTAETTLRLNPFSTDAQIQPSASQKVDIATEKEVAESQEVRDAAAKASDGKYTAAQLKNAVKVSTVTSTAIISFTATAASGQDAADMADAVAHAYLDSRGQVIQDSARTYTHAIDARIKALQSDARTNAVQLRELRSQKVQAQLVSTDVGEVITPAQAPSSPSSVGTAYYVLAGLVGGLLAGVVAAWIRDRTDRRVRFPDRAGELWGAMPLEAEAGDPEESAALLGRRLDVAPGGAETVAVVGLPDQRERAEELAAAFGGSARAFVLDRVDSTAAEALDAYRTVLVVATAQTRCAPLARLAGELAQKAGRETVPVFLS